jgi:hypothetical protein
MGTHIEWAIFMATIYNNFLAFRLAMTFTKKEAQDLRLFKNIY